MRLSLSALVTASSFDDAFKVLRALRRSFSLNRTLVRFSAAIIFPPLLRISLAPTAYKPTRRRLATKPTQPPSWKNLLAPGSAGQNASCWAVLLTPRVLHGTEFRGANYVKVAEAFGARSNSVGTEAEYAGELKEAFRFSTFTVIEVRIDPSRYADYFDAIREL